MKASLTRRDAQMLSLCLVVLLTILLLRWAFAAYALPTIATWSANDGPMWIVAIVSWLNGGGFNNPLTNFYTEPHWRDGQFSLVGYLPLHMLLLATASTGNDVFGVYKGIWLIESAGLTILGLALVSTLYRLKQQKSLTIWLLVAIALLCAGTLGFDGRPDTTFIFLLSIGCLYASVAAVPSSVVVGMLLGLLGACQPTAALMVVACIVIWYSMLWTGSEVLRRLVIVIPATLATFIAAISTYYSPLDVLHALFSNAPSHFFGYFAPQLFLETQMLDYWRPLFGLTLLTGVGSLVFLLFAQKPVSWGWCLVGICTLVAAAVHAFVLRPHCTYNAQAMLPIVLTTTMVAATKSKKYCAFGCLTLGMASLALPLQAALLYDHVSRGMTLRSAHVAYERSVAQIPRDAWLGIDSQLWQLSLDGRDWHRSFHFNWEGPRNRNASNSALFVREGTAPNRGESLLGSPLSTINDPSKGIAHRLWLDCNTKRLVNVLGREIYTPVKGFGFSVYVPLDWENWCPTGGDCFRETGYLDGCEIHSAPPGS